MNEHIDKKISRILFIIIAGIVCYWLIEIGINLYGWLQSLGPADSSWWGSVGSFCLQNISIILVIYIIMCLQSAGIAEFKFRKDFLKSFLLAIVLTPPGMMIWCHRTPMPAVSTEIISDERKE